jgi:transglutaminase-like putative cysteine protease
LKARVAVPLLIILIILVQLVPVHAATQYKYTLTYVFENRGGTATTLERDDLAVPLFINSPSQIITVISATPPLGPTYTDEDGNSLADPNMGLSIPANGNLTYTVIYSISPSGLQNPQIDSSKAGTASDIPTVLVLNYTATTETFWSNNTEIAALARRITAGETTVLGELVHLVAWFHANVTYATHELPLYPNQTLNQRQGDCDDQSILLISMLRSLGIPSYLEIGVVFNSGIDSSETIWDGHLAISEKGLGWHGWAMVYTPPWGWIPVDLTYTSENDPLRIIQNAAEYTPVVVSAMKVSNQVYTTLSVQTRQRITSSTIYVTSTETVGGLQPSWIDPTMITLGLVVAAAIGFMFYTSRRPRQQAI